MRSVLMLLIVLLSTRAFAISTMSGIVRDMNGNPIDGVDLDFIDMVTGVKLYTPGDNTDASGYYSVTVLNSTFYKVTFAPPPGTHFLGKILNNFDLTTSRDYDVVLDNGLTISGAIVDEFGAPVGDVNIDVDSLSGGRVFNPNDNSDLISGLYSIVVPPGNYRLRYDSPPGSQLIGVQLDSVTVLNDTVIDITMLSGPMLRGIVSNRSGGRIRDVDIDLRDQTTGMKVFVSNNVTDTLGSYLFAAPVGLYSLRFAPPLGSPYVGVIQDSFLVSGDMIRNQILDSGVVVTVNVVDSSGAPVFKSDLDFKPQSSLIKIYTPNDKTNRAGSTKVAVPPDLYTVQVDPPLGSIYNQVIIDSVPLFSDTTLNFILPELPRINLTGSVTDASGLPLADIIVDARLSLNNQKIFIGNNTTDEFGQFSVDVPIGTLDMLFSPPQGTRFVALRVNNVTFAQDTAWSPVSLNTGVVVNVNVLDRDGIPAAKVDLDFFSESSLLEVLTPYDNTDINGTSRVVLPVDMYSLFMIPPAGSSSQPTNIRNIDISVDTTLTLQLTGTGNVDSPDFTLLQNYPNPFNDETVIQYVLLTDSHVTLTLYNVLGQRVTTLVDGFRTTGIYQTVWDGRNDHKDYVASGVYFYQMRAAGGKESRRLIIIR